jgi:hypothetical protein
MPAFFLLCCLGRQNCPECAWPLRVRLARMPPPSPDEFACVRGGREADSVSVLRQVVAECVFRPPMGRAEGIVASARQASVDCRRQLIAGVS